jgi:hypothetical protein
MVSDEFYFKRVKSKGIVYMSVWRRVKDDKDVYCCTLGSAKACYEKFVRLKDLEVKDKHLTEIKDKLLRQEKN